MDCVNCGAKGAAKEYNDAGHNYMSSRPLKRFFGSSKKNATVFLTVFLEV
jgi:hypothetical protein